MNETHGVASKLPVAESSGDSPLAKALAHYAELQELGQAPPPHAYAAQHPEFADELLGCLRQMEWIGQVADDLSHGLLVGELDTEAAPANRVLGDYRIIRQIGRGGMGIVYEADQISLDRRVALKVLPLAGILDQRQLQRFKNEARAAASLHHGNIVPVYGVGCERGTHFFAMQYIEGTTLEALIRERRGHDERQVLPSTIDNATALPVSTGDTGKLAALSTTPVTLPAAYFQRVARLGMQAAGALDHAHQQGIVHRDIKPSNLMVDEHDNLWVTDFGLARMETESNLTMTGDVLGTLRYMSPEQALAKRPLIDHRTDIYSLGVTLYELLTLEPAFAETDRQALLRRIAEDEPRRPRSVVKAIPIELETIVWKSIEKEPGDRYATAKELAADLRHYLNDEPIIARRRNWREKAAKWARRHIAAVTAALVGLLICSAALAVSTLWVLQSKYQSEKNAESARKAENEQRQQTERAEANLLNSVETVSKLLTRVSEETLFTTPGATQIRRRLLQDAAEQLESLCDNQDDPRLLLDAANVFAQIGKIDIHISDFELSLAPLNRAKELLAACKRQPLNVGLNERQLATESSIEFCLAAANWSLQRLEEADLAANRSVTAAQQILVHDSTPENREVLAAHVFQRGLIAFSRGQRDDSLADLLEARALIRQCLLESPSGERHESTRYQVRECGILVALTTVAHVRQQPEAALEFIHQALELADEVDSRLADRRDSPSNAHQASTETKLATGDLDVSSFPLPLPQQIRWHRAQAMNVLGRIHRAAAEDTKACECYERAIGLLEPLARDFPDVYWTRTELFSATTGLLLVSSPERAPSAVQKVIQSWRELPAALKPQAGNNSAWLIVTSKHLSDFSEFAIEMAQYATESRPGWSYHNTLGVALFRARRYSDAVIALQKSNELSRNDKRAAAFNGLFLAMSLWELGRQKDANDAYAIALSAMEKISDPELKQFQAEAAETLARSP